MVTAAPAMSATSRPADTAPPLPLSATSPRSSVARARPIPVAAYPAGVPRWVTYDGRRHRVVAVYDQPALDQRLMAVPRGAVRMQVELADGRLLTLLHDRGGWFARGS
jgi:hypothetical protein